MLEKGNKIFENGMKKLYKITIIQVSGFREPNEVI